MSTLRTWLLVTVTVVALLCTSSASALIVDGKEVEDIYQYILDVLKADADQQEQYRLQTERDPNYRGFRPYAYSSLTHLSTEDLIYGAVQGGLTAVREMGPNASPERVAARAEANIQRVMEVVPMLTTTFVAPEALLRRMSVSGKKDHLQLFLLKRCRPGQAANSLFSEFWQDELRRNRTGLVRALEVIGGDLASESDVLQLALPMYVDTVQELYTSAFLSDAGIAQLTPEQQGALTPALAMSDDAVRAQMADPEALSVQTKNLAKCRQLLAKQQDPDMHRGEAILALSRSLMERLDASYPTLATMSDSGEALPAATPAAAEEEAPEPPADAAETPAGFPKLGIPTLKGF